MHVDVKIIQFVRTGIISVVPRYRSGYPGTLGTFLSSTILQVLSSNSLHLARSTRLVLHVQLNNRKQKVAHPHKIVNAGHYARLNLHQQVIVSPLVPKMPTIAIFGDVK